MHKASLTSKVNKEAQQTSLDYSSTAPGLPSKKEKLSLRPLARRLVKRDVAPSPTLVVLSDSSPAAETGVGRTEGLMREGVGVRLRRSPSSGCRSGTLSSSKSAFMFALLRREFVDASDPAGEGFLEPVGVPAREPLGVRVSRPRLGVGPSPGEATAVVPPAAETDWAREAVSSALRLPPKLTIHLHQLRAFLASTASRCLSSLAFSNAARYRSYDSRKFLSTRELNISSPRGFVGGGMGVMGAERLDEGERARCERSEPGSERMVGEMGERGGEV